MTELQARLKQFYKVYEAKTEAGETSPLTLSECATLEAFVQFVSMIKSIENFNKEGKMTKFYMITTHPRLGKEKTELKGIDTWHGALEEALAIIAEPLCAMHSLKGIEIETE